MSHDFADLDDEPTPPRRHNPPGRSPALTWLIVVVGVLVAVAAGFFIYDRVSYYRAKARMQEINTEINETLKKRPASGLTQAQEYRILELEMEEKRIVRDHPSLKR